MKLWPPFCEIGEAASSLVASACRAGNGGESRGCAAKRWHNSPG